jgi:hypothetical protein
MVPACMHVISSLPPQALDAVDAHLYCIKLNIRPWSGLVRWLCRTLNQGHIVTLVVTSGSLALPHGERTGASSSPPGVRSGSLAWPHAEPPGDHITSYHHHVRHCHRWSSPRVRSGSLALPHAEPVAVYDDL